MSDLLDRLEEIELRAMRLSQLLRELEGQPHKPRDKDDKRIQSPLTMCARDCPTCAVESQISQQQFKYSDERRELLIRIAMDAQAKREGIRERARKPRSRSPSLVMRGLQAAKSEYPDAKPASLIALLEGAVRTYDDHDVELNVVDKNILVRDLNSAEVKLIRYENLGKYLRRLRDS